MPGYNNLESNLSHEKSLEKWYVFRFSPALTKQLLNMVYTLYGV